MKEFSEIMIRGLILFVVMLALTLSEAPRGIQVIVAIIGVAWFLLAAFKKTKKEENSNG